MQTLTLFVSSPGDVRDERQAVGRVVERLQARYWNFIRLEPVLWEKEPLRATAHFNEELIRPSDCDLFVCILWSRLGSPLPSQFNRKDGTRFDSGTEWELEEATEAFEERAAKPGEKAKPDILVYRRMSEAPAGSADERQAKAAQKKKLDAFCERFFFNPDKTIRRAFSPYETTDEFSGLFEQHLEKLLLRHIQLQRGLAQDAVRPLPLEGSPFKGLGTYEFEDAPLFFGRNRPIAEALAKLKENHAAGHAFLLIYGGSGYGKSSLMKAGLAPRLTADGYLPEVGTWAGTSLLPVEGDSPPLETLARALIEAVPDLAKLRDTSGKESPAPASTPLLGPSPSRSSKKKRKSAPAPVPSPAKQEPQPLWDVARLARTMAKPEELPFALAAIMAALDRMSAGKPAHLLVLVDQLEEIFTAREIGQEERDRFFHVLAALTMTRRVWIVATMRSEFFPRVPEHRDLFQLIRHGGGYILSPPELPELHQIIRYPALAAGLQFERHPESGRDLSEQIYQDAADAHDALPLLEFTLEELYQRRQENVLTWAAYGELGGLSGAIARRAQETYDALPSETRREAARQVFGELVTLDAGNEGPATRRRAKRETLHDAHPGAPAFLEAFIDAKLLVTGSENDTATVTLAHEALITHWPVLKQWIEDHRDLLMARRRLEDATRLWSEGHHSTRFYLTEGRLAEAERVATSGVFRLSVEEMDLVRLSRVRAKRKLRLFQGATVVFAGLAVAAGALGVVARQKQHDAEVAESKANESAAETRRSLAAADFDAGAGKVATGAPDEALPYLLSALEGDPRNLDAQALLLETLRHTAWSFPEIELRHPLPVRMLSFGADRDTLFAATDSSSSGEGFNTTLRWDLKQQPSIGAMLAPRWGEITLTLSVGPGARRLVLQRDYKFLGDADLVDATSMRPIARLPVTRSHKVPATCFSWSPDGLLFAYPAKTDDDAPAASPYVWRIIDANSGKTLRETDPLPAESAAPLASSLDRERLRVVFADGSVAEYPVNPTLPPLLGKSLGGRFDFAVFSPDGLKILTSTRPEDREPQKAETYAVVAKPAENQFLIESVGFAADDTWTSTAALTERFPWARWESPFWEKVAGDARESSLPLKVEGSRLDLVDISGVDHAPRAPIRAESQIECAAFSGSRVAVGTASGMLTVHEVLPRIGHGFPPIIRTAKPAGSPDEEREDGWATVESGKEAALQHRGHDWRLRGEDGKIVSLQPHPDWMYPMYAARPADAAFVVMGGYSAGSGGYSSAGMVICDPVTGALKSDLEPVDEIRGLIFLGESHRVAAMASTEVIIAEAEANGFRRLASLPVVDAVSLYHVASRGWLAVATAREIQLFDTKDFSKVASLPVAVAETWSGWDDAKQDWAEDPARGWLAYRRDGRLDLWSLRNNRALVAGLSVPMSGETMSFGEKDDLVSLHLAKDASLVLARTAGLDATQLSALRDLSESLSGTGFAADSRSLVKYSSADRRGRAAKLDRTVASTLLPDLGPSLDRIAALDFRTAVPEAWVPVWQRLAVGREEGPSIARWASDLGPAHSWFSTYLRGLIASSDAAFYAWQRGESPLAEKEIDHTAPLPHDDRIAAFHRLAGDSDAMRDLKQAAWLVLRTDPRILGPQLLKDTDPAEFEGVDLAAVEKLDPQALKALRSALNDGDMRDWRRVAIDELPARARALEILDASVSSTLAAYEKEPSVAAALDHAEALALRGQRDEAEKFLAGKVPEDAALNLRQAHFLVASRLHTTCLPALDKALDTLGSPWLWRSWLSLPLGGLKDRIARVMKTVGGQGPAAVASMKAALESGDAGAVTAVLEHAKELPALLRDYATARALWSQGKKAEVFSLWPETTPDFQLAIDTGDWGGWEEALPWEDSSAFTDEIAAELKTLDPDPDAPLETLQAHATRLLEPAATTTFGPRRVRDAMVRTAFLLAGDKKSSHLVSKLVERARLAGASHLDCLRIEARSFMAVGEFTAAYSRWIALIDSDDAEIISSDYLEAARCVIEDMQDAAAIELLMRGKLKYPADPNYAFDAAWLMLTTTHPEEAGIFLEHGFTIPFAEDQKQVALAMLVCAAEQTMRTDRADGVFRELVALAPDWGSEDSVKGLGWPLALEQSLLAVAKRNHPDAPADIE